MRSLGEQIRASRIAAGLTQRALGERAGIVGKYVSEIERGTRDVPLSTLAAIVERGLRLRLEITFQGEKSAPRSVPSYVEELATAIVALADEKRAKVVGLVRAILELAQ
ncbi:MAG TPA: helix-turn-helix domain-containing protein [Kofleriaceae bacterium]|nr:helix-turn-helix domain-containing protein [Kofleriaceae bacterium]